MFKNLFFVNFWESPKNPCKIDDLCPVLTNRSLQIVQLSFFAGWLGVLYCAGKLTRRSSRVFAWYNINIFLWLLQYLNRDFLWQDSWELAQTPKPAERKARLTGRPDSQVYIPVSLSRCSENWKIHPMGAANISKGSKYSAGVGTNSPYQSCYPPQHFDLVWPVFFN